MKGVFSWFINSSQFYPRQVTSFHCGFLPPPHSCTFATFLSIVFNFNGLRVLSLLCCLGRSQPAVSCETQDPIAISFILPRWDCGTISAIYVFIRGADGRGAHPLRVAGGSHNGKILSQVIMNIPNNSPPLKQPCTLDQHFLNMPFLKMNVL